MVIEKLEYKHSKYIEFKKGGKMKSAKPETNEEIAIHFKDVSKIFGKNAGIRDVNFQVKVGSFHVLIGANGAGKTTLIRSLLGIYKSFSGEILINGITNMKSKAYKNVSYISELPLFPNEFTARQYLIWVGRIAGMNDQQVRVKIEKLAESLNIGHVLDGKPNKFSSGQKQKIMLMKILIEDAKVIIMDEPTANLDPSARIVFFDEIKKIHDEGKTILLSSHNLSEIEEKVSQVTVLKNGQIVFNNDKTSKRTLINIFKEFGHKV